MTGPFHSGHDRAFREWRAALSGPRLHHGWLLAGRRGLGKVAFALSAARELVAVEGTHQPKDHPDILLLTHLPKDEKEERKRNEGKPFELKRNITVGQIREMQQRLTTRPTLGPRRAIVIPAADDLEKNAANALLKSLEEPPAGTFFLLVTHRPGRLLPTIRSRCRLLGFSRATDEEVGQYLETTAPKTSPDIRSLAVRAAEGSPGVALEFVEQDLAPLHRLMLEILGKGDAGFALRGALADAIGQRPTRERQLAAIELARSVVGREMRVAAKRRLPGIIHAHSELNRLSAQAPTYNFDAGLLVMEIGTLLASAAAPREMA
ncbi:MAG TPA: DNA polymerase III subunit delta' [Sphingomonadaceae bacterium]|nr:DNA polymerase III subunit delta' [Sphingomonadaceae bacterium]